MQDSSLRLAYASPEICSAPILAWIDMLRSCRDNNGREAAATAVVNTLRTPSCAPSKLAPNLGSRMLLFLVALRAVRDKEPDFGLRYPRSPVWNTGVR